MVLEDVILIRKPEKALLKHVSKCIFFILLFDLECAFLFVFCFAITGKETEFLLSSDPEKI